MAANGITRFGLGGDAIATGLFAIPPESEQRAIAADSAGAFDDAADAAIASLPEGAALPAISRTGETIGVVRGVVGGAPQVLELSAATVDELEAKITEAKAGATAAPYFQVTRTTPFAFTVTRLSQILTAYYFLFFLVILPVLGLIETPRRVPDTIAKPVTGQAQGAS